MTRSSSGSGSEKATPRIGAHVAVEDNLSAAGGETPPIETTASPLTLAELAGSGMPGRPQLIQKESATLGRPQLESAVWRRVVRGWIDDLLAETAADRDPRWGGGAISPSPYETAWVAMVRDPHQPERLAFPDALRALLAMQQSDGAWGGVSPYTMGPTLAGLLALVKAPTQTAN